MSDEAMNPGDQPSSSTDRQRAGRIIPASSPPYGATLGTSPSPRVAPSRESVEPNGRRSRFSPAGRDSS